MKRWARWLAIALAVVAVIAYAGASIAFYVKQSFWIHDSPRDRVPEPAAYGLQGAELRIASAAPGEVIAAWWLPASAPEAPAVLYLIGVGHHLGTAAPALSALRRQGLSVLAVEYRGFGRSDGQASEAVLYEDGAAAWEKLLALAPRAESYNLYGHSIGGAVAIELARDSRRRVAALVLESPFTSMADTIRQSRIMRALPTRMLLDQKYESLAKLAWVRAPMLVLHGEDDEFVPPRMGRAIAAGSSPPAFLAITCKAGHSDAFSGSPAAQSLVGKFIRSPGSIKPPSGCLARGP